MKPHTYYLIALIALASACSPEAKLRKAERLIAAAERSGAKWKIDTVYKEVPVFVPEIVTDTIFQSEQGDTVYITKDRLKLKYVNLPGDSVFIEGKCEADTVRVEVPVSVTKTISAGYSLWQLIGISIFVALLCFMLGDLWRRFRK